MSTINLKRRSVSSDSGSSVSAKWRQVLTELRENHGITGLKLTDMGRAVPQSDQLIGETLLLAVPHERVRKLMQSQLQAELSEALRTVFAQDVLVAYVIDPELDKQQGYSPRPGPEESEAAVSASAQPAGPAPVRSSAEQSPSLYTAGTPESATYPLRSHRPLAAADSVALRRASHAQIPVRGRSGAVPGCPIPAALRPPGSTRATPSRRL